MKLSYRNIFILLLLVPLLFFAIFFLAPLLVVVLSSIGYDENQLTLQHYAKILFDEYHWGVIASTFRIAFYTTAVCVILGYPLAWYIVRVVRLKAWRRICIIMLIIPLFTSNIVRSFGWMVLLGRRGLVNDTLTFLGIADKPIRFIGSESGIVIGLVYILLPFVVLAVGNTLANLDKSLEHASSDLGAHPLDTFLRIVFPLSLPGLIAGAIMVFSMAVSSYVTPALLSGGKISVLSMLIFQQYSTVFDFNYGGALSVVLLVLTLLLVGITSKIGASKGGV